jgi:putative methionine-R-sulfoxide reductase with GAF domain
MTLSNFLKNRSLGFKLNVIVALVLTTLLVITLIVLSSNMNNLTLRTGQQRVQEEIAIIQNRFEQAEQQILTDAKLLAASPDLVEAMAKENADQIRTIILLGAGELGVDDIDVLDVNGTRFTTASAAIELADTEAEDALLALGLIGVESAAIVVDNEGGEQEILLAGGVPLRDTAGVIVGALLVGRQIDDEFLREINFFRQSVDLKLVHAEQVVAQTLIEPTEEQMEEESNEPAAEASIDTDIVDQSALSQTLNGETIIGAELVSFGDGELYAQGYAPLEGGSDTKVALVISFKVQQLVASQRQLMTNLAFIFIALTLLGVASVAWFVWKSVAAPIGNLTSVVEQIMGGDHSQQADVTTTDEIGQLARGFNSMTTNLRSLITGLERRSRALEANGEVSRSLSTILDRQELVFEVVHQVQSVFNYYHAHIYLVDETAQNLIMVGGTGEAGQTMLNRKHSIPMGRGLVGRAAQTKSVVLVPDVSIESGWLPNPLLADTKSEIAVPIIISDEILGVLDVQENKVRGLDEDDASLLRSLANQVAVALTNASLFEQTVQAKDEAEKAGQEAEKAKEDAERAKEEAERAKAEAERAKEQAQAANKILEQQIWQTAGLAQLNEVMRGEQDIPTLANNIIQHLCRYLRVQIGALYVVEGQYLKRAGRFAYNGKNQPQQFKFGEGLVGQTALEKRAVLVRDVPDDYITMRSGLGEQPPTNILLFPFIYNDDVLGVIELGTLGEFSQAQTDFIETALASIAITFNSALARTRINELLAQTRPQVEGLQVSGS